MTTVLAIAFQVRLVHGKIGGKRIRLNDKIVHATPERALPAFRRRGFVSQSFADNFRLGHIASPGRACDFRKQPVGDFDGERFHQDERYYHSAKTATPALSRRTYAAKEQAIRARPVEYHLRRPLRDSCFLGMIYPEFRHKASLRAPLRRTFGASLFLSETAGERIQSAHKIATVADRRYR
jgi:hypothetical protein